MPVQQLRGEKPVVIAQHPHLAALGAQQLGQGGEQIHVPAVELPVIVLPQVMKPALIILGAAPRGVEGVLHQVDAAHVGGGVHPQVQGDHPVAGLGGFGELSGRGLGRDIAQGAQVRGRRQGREHGQAKYSHQQHAPAELHGGASFLCLKRCMGKQPSGRGKKRLARPEANGNSFAFSRQIPAAGPGRSP